MLAYEHGTWAPHGVAAAGGSPLVVRADGWSRAPGGRVDDRLPLWANAAPIGNASGSPAQSAPGHAVAELPRPVGWMTTRGQQRGDAAEAYHEDDRYSADGEGDSMHASMRRAHADLLELASKDPRGLGWTYTEGGSESADKLPADFRVQLQLVDCMVSQGRLLRKLSAQQDKAAVQLDSIRQSAAEQVRLNQPFMDNYLYEKNIWQKEVLLLLRKKAASDIESHELAKSTAGSARNNRPSYARSNSGNSQRERGSETQFSQRATCNSEAPLEGRVPRRTRSTNSMESGDRAVHEVEHIFDEQEEHDHKEDPFLGRVLNHPACDMMCGMVIACNSITMGYSAEMQIQWGLEHIGGEEWNQTDWLKNIGYFFVTFYFFELLLKIAVFKRNFFTCDIWEWNVFDLVLVALGAYDLTNEVFGLGSGMDVTWIRLLRLLKMLKMLRVVRLMRFFKELRRMMASIAGTMSTLMWSMLMLFLMVYIFGLCFLQAVIGYLADTKPENIDLESLELMKQYWNSVMQACLSLFFAVTGGADWEVLGAPLWLCGEYYYMLFIFYICFSAVAVLNVLTGMVVDATIRVGEEDENSVVEEMSESPQVRKFKAVLRDLSVSQSIDKESFEHALDTEQAAEFMKKIEVTKADCRHAFARITMETGKTQGSVFLEDILEGCLRIKEDMKGIDMVAMKGELRRIMDTLSGIESMMEAGGEARDNHLSEADD